MISVKNAFENITKDECWIKNSLIYFVIIIIPMIISAISIASMPDTKNLTFQQSMNAMGSSAMAQAMGLIAGVISMGFFAVYLRNLIADNRASVPNIMNYFGEIIGAGLKMYLAMIAYNIGVVITGIVIALIFCIIFIPLAIAIKSTAITVTAIVIVTTVSLILAAIAGCYYLALSINFSAKNLELSAFFDFKNAKKYFCKEFWSYLLTIFLLTLAWIIAVVLVLIPVFLITKNVVSTLAVYFILAPIVSMIVALINVNLLSQVAEAAEQ